MDEEDTELEKARKAVLMGWRFEEDGSAFLARVDWLITKAKEEVLEEKNEAKEMALQNALQYEKLAALHDGAKECIGALEMKLQEVEADRDSESRWAKDYLERAEQAEKALEKWGHVYRCQCLHTLPDERCAPGAKT